MLDIFEISPIDKKDLDAIADGALIEYLSMPAEEVAEQNPVAWITIIIGLIAACARKCTELQKRKEMSSGGSCRRPGSIPGEGPQSDNGLSVSQSVSTGNEDGEI